MKAVIQKFLLLSIRLKVLITLESIYQRGRTLYSMPSPFTAFTPRCAGYLRPMFAWGWLIVARLIGW